MLKPVPEVVTWPIVTAALPEFVSVIVCGVLVEPTTTLPKFTLPGFGVSELPAATALPVNVSVCGDPVALSWNEMLPVAPAVDVGVNCTLKVAL